MENFNYGLEFYYGEFFSIKNSKLNEGMIDYSDVRMVRKAIQDWFNIIFKYMDDLVNINKKTLQYNDKNIVKYL